MLKTWRTTPRRAPDDDHAPLKEAVADDATFSIGLALVDDLDRDALEDESRVFEVQAPLGKRLSALGRIVGDAYQVSVATRTTPRNRGPP